MWTEYWPYGVLGYFVITGMILAFNYQNGRINKFFEENNNEHKE